MVLSSLLDPWDFVVKLHSSSAEHLVLYHLLVVLLLVTVMVLEPTTLMQFPLLRFSQLICYLLLLH